jgi:hypothetical protein
MTYFIGFVKNRVEERLAWKGCDVVVEPSFDEFGQAESP